MVSCSFSLTMRVSCCLAIRQQELLIWNSFWVKLVGIKKKIIPSALHNFPMKQRTIDTTSTPCSQVLNRWTSHGHLSLLLVSHPNTVSEANIPPKGSGVNSISIKYLDMISNIWCLYTYEDLLPIWRTSNIWSYLYFSHLIGMLSANYETKWIKQILCNWRMKHSSA